MRLLLIIIFFLASCTSDVIKQTALKQDNDSIIEQIMSVRFQLDSIVSFDSLRIVEKEKLLAKCDSLIKRQLNYNDIVIEGNYLLMQINQIKKSKQKLINTNDSLISHLVKKKEQIEKQYYQEKKERLLIADEKNELKKKIQIAQKLNVTDFKVTGIGFNSSLFAKQKQYETNRQDKIKKILISFIFPENKIAEKEQKNISCIIYSADKNQILKKDTSLFYFGNEQKVMLKLNANDFKKGSHKIELIINKELKAQINYIVQ